MLAGGLYSGQIAIWDVRVGADPIHLTSRESSHSGYITSLLWSCNKAFHEFFTGGQEGQILWWDMRNLNAAYDSLFLDPDAQNGTENSFGVSTIEFEPTIPNKYMVGSENGMVYTCNRKYKSVADKIMGRVRKKWPKLNFFKIANLLLDNVPHGTSLFR
jgi:dynein intermediate chain 2